MRLWGIFFWLTPSNVTITLINQPLSHTKPGIVAETVDFCRSSVVLNIPFNFNLSVSPYVAGLSGNGQKTQHVLPKVIIYFIRKFFAAVYHGGDFRSPLAGFVSSLPFSENREPWQGQSQLLSCGFHFRAHPRWGHLGLVGINRLHNDATPLMAS